MDAPTISRRTLLLAAATTGAAWAIGDVAQVDDALAYAAAVMRGHRPPEFRALSPGDAADLEAIAARIIPTDDTPGATEAGVIHFIDRGLATFAAAQKPVVQRGLADLRRRAAKVGPGARSFVALTPAEQDRLLTKMEKSAFFASIREATMVGMFANPSWGGNRDQVGWTLVGFQPKSAHQFPFGYYDAEATRQG